LKRLYKSRTNKVIDGVCGGIAEYFEVDPVLVRILFVLFFFFWGSAVIAYIVGMIIMPRRPLVEDEYPEPAAERSRDTGAEPVPEQRSQAAVPAGQGPLIIGIVLVALGAFFLMGNFHFFRDIYWWVRHRFWDFLVPGIIIAVGLALIVRGTDKNSDNKQE